MLPLWEAVLQRRFTLAGTIVDQAKQVVIGGEAKLPLRALRIRALGCGGFGLHTG